MYDRALTADGLAGHAWDGPAPGLAFDEAGLEVVLADLAERIVTGAACLAQVRQIAARGVELPIAHQRYRSRPGTRR